MKLHIIATTIGAAIAVAASTSSNGQGCVSFDNYLTFNSAGCPILMPDRTT
jgi:hypothetical protein